jgi:hypothetical protein
MITIDINTMTPAEIKNSISQLPRTERDLKKLQNVPLFEYLFTLTGGKIEAITRGKNKGKPKYVAPEGYNYNRDNVYKILTGMSREEITSVDILLGSDFYFRPIEQDRLDAETPTELYRRKLYRWYWSMVPLNTPKEELDLINKSTLWTQLYNELLEKAKLVHTENGFFQINDYNKYHFELQPQIDTERDLLKQLNP